MRMHLAFRCVDPTAMNFDSSATLSDGTCTYKIEGCTDSTAKNFAADANTVCAADVPRCCR